MLYSEAKNLYDTIMLRTEPDHPLREEAADYFDRFQKEVAEKLGLPQSEIGQYEKDVSLGKPLDNLNVALMETLKNKFELHAVQNPCSFDWDKAAELIRQYAPLNVRVTMMEDPAFDSFDIVKDAVLVPPFDGADTVVASTWATPVIIFDEDPSQQHVCLRTDPKYLTTTNWPLEALEKLFEKDPDRNRAGVAFNALHAGKVEDYELCDEADISTLWEYHLDEVGAGNTLSSIWYVRGVMERRMPEGHPLVQQYHAQVAALEETAAAELGIAVQEIREPTEDETWRQIENLKMNRFAYRANLDLEATWDQYQDWAEENPLSFDWDKAASLIREHKPYSAEIVLRGAFSYGNGERILDEKTLMRRPEIENETLAVPLTSYRQTFELALKRSPVSQTEYFPCNNYDMKYALERDWPYDALERMFAGNEELAGKAYEAIHTDSAEHDKEALRIYDLLEEFEAARRLTDWGDIRYGKAQIEWRMPKGHPLVQRNNEAFARLEKEVAERFNISAGLLKYHDIAIDLNSYEPGRECEKNAREFMQWTKENPVCFDWDKAAELIREHKPHTAEIALVNNHHNTPVVYEKILDGSVLTNRPDKRSKIPLSSQDHRYVLAIRKSLTENMRIFPCTSHEAKYAKDKNWPQEALEKLFSGDLKRANKAFKALHASVPYVCEELNITTEAKSMTEEKKKFQKRDYRQEMTDKLIQSIEQGEIPWQKAWVNRERPYNMITGKPYKGANSLGLSIEGFEDPRFLTLKQANALGMKIQKGEQGLPVEYWDWYNTVEKTDERTGTKTKEKVRRDRPKVYHSTVFNASQIEGMPPYSRENPQLTPVQIQENCERVMAKMAVPFEFKGDRAFYLVEEDKIYMPPKERFKDTHGFYGVAMHELAHATGHESRSDPKRETLYKYHEDKTFRAKEELRAEIASFFLAAELGVTTDEKHVENHAGYVQHWVEALKKDKNEIFRAARDAELICDYMTKDLEISKNHEPVKAPEKAEPAKENIKEYAAKTEKNMYKGVITEITNEAIFQRVGANSIVKHDLKSFDKLEPVSVGDQVQFNYEKGKGKAKVLSIYVAKEEVHQLGKTAEAEKEQEAEKTLREANTQKGTYTGEIVRIEGDHFIQAVSSKSIMRHEKANFPEIGEIKVGDDARVSYSKSGGKVKVQEKEKTEELAL